MTSTRVPRGLARLQGRPKPYGIVIFPDGVTMVQEKFVTESTLGWVPKSVVTCQLPAPKRKGNKKTTFTAVGKVLSVHGSMPEAEEKLRRYDPDHPDEFENPEVCFFAVTPRRRSRTLPSPNQKPTPTVTRKAAAPPGPKTSSLHVAARKRVRRAKKTLAAKNLKLIAPINGSLHNRQFNPRPMGDTYRPTTISLNPVVKAAITATNPVSLTGRVTMDIPEVPDPTAASTSTTTLSVPKASAQVSVPTPIPAVIERTRPGPKKPTPVKTTVPVTEEPVPPTEPQPTEAVVTSPIPTQEPPTIVPVTITAIPPVPDNPTGRGRGRGRKGRGRGRGVTAPTEPAHVGTAGTRGKRGRGRGRGRGKSSRGGSTASQPNQPAHPGQPATVSTQPGQPPAGSTQPGQPPAGSTQPQPQTAPVKEKDYLYGAGGGAELFYTGPPEKILKPNLEHANFPTSLVHFKNGDADAGMTAEDLLRNRVHPGPPPMSPATLQKRKEHIDSMYPIFRAERIAIFAERKLMKAYNRRQKKITLEKHIKQNGPLVCNAAEKMSRKLLELANMANVWLKFDTTTRGKMRYEIVGNDKFKILDCQQGSFRCSLGMSVLTGDIREFSPPPLKENLHYSDKGHLIYEHNPRQSAVISQPSKVTPGTKGKRKATPPTPIYSEHDLAALRAMVRGYDLTQEHIFDFVPFSLAQDSEALDVLSAMLDHVQYGAGSPDFAVPREDIFCALQLVRRQCERSLHMEQVVQEHRATHVNLRAECDKYAEEKHRLSATIAQFEQERRISGSQLTTLQADNRRLMTQLRELRGTLDASRNTESQLQALKTEKTHLEAHLKEAETLSQNLSSQVDYLGDALNRAHEQPVLPSYENVPDDTDVFRGISNKKLKSLWAAYKNEGSFARKLQRILVPLEERVQDKTLGPDDDDSETMQWIYNTVIRYFPKTPGRETREERIVAIRSAMNQGNRQDRNLYTDKVAARPKDVLPKGASQKLTRRLNIKGLKRAEAEKRDRVNPSKKPKPPAAAQPVQSQPTFAPTQPAQTLQSFVPTQPAPSQPTFAPTQPSAPAHLTYPLGQPTTQAHPMYAQSQAVHTLTQPAAPANLAYAPQTAHLTYAPAHPTYAPPQPAAPGHPTYAPSQPGVPTHTIYAPTQPAIPAHSTYGPNLTTAPAHPTYARPAASAPTTYAPSQQAPTSALNQYAAPPVTPDSYGQHQTGYLPSPSPEPESVNQPPRRQPLAPMRLDYGYDNRAQPPNTPLARPIPGHDPERYPSPEPDMDWE